MYFKVTGEHIDNSREPIEGGFEQNGLTYDYDAGRLVVVSDTEVRDKTNEELFEIEEDNIFATLFNAAEGHIYQSLTPYGYGFTVRKAADGSENAVANLAWCDSVFALHDTKAATVTADTFMDMDMDALFDYTSIGNKPFKISTY